MKRFPPNLNGYTGIYCLNCNTVFYTFCSPIFRSSLDGRRCPICRRFHCLLWITECNQPKDLSAEAEEEE